MKKTLLLFSLMLVVLFSFGQWSYDVTYNQDAGNPGGINTLGDSNPNGWTQIMAGPQSTNIWSPAQTIPFPFSFYGNSVTQFKASQNGLVSFDVAAATLPNVNDNLPSVNLPDSVICGFWDEFTASAPTGTNDDIVVQVFGTAPNRQLWIKWYSFEMGNPTASFSYFAIVLEETTNNIYVVDLYGAGGLTATVGAQLNTTTAVQFGTNTIASEGNGDGNTDNDYYLFVPKLLVPDDAGVSQILNPVNPISTGIQNIDVDVENYGTNNLNSFDIYWEINGTPQTTFNWTGTLTPGSSTGSITLGTYNFPAGTHTIKTWTANPNTNLDQNPSNDTLEISVCTPLAGTYTIGSTGDYADFSDAAAALASCGINAPVTFNVQPGTYYDYFTLPVISGSSATNTITFDGADASVVRMIDTAYTAAIIIQGADYVTLKNLTIENKIMVDAWGVKLMDTANYVTIDYCVFNMYHTAGVSDVVAINTGTSLTSETSEGYNANYLTISNNVITGGQIGIHLEGLATAGLYMNEVNVINNTIYNVDDYGIYMDNIDSVTIRGNTIYDVQQAAGDGTYLSDIVNFYISENNIIAKDYAIAIYDGNYSLDGVTPGSTTSFIANNMLISTGDDALFIDDFEEANIFHNSCYGAGNGAGLYMNDVVNVDIRNNIFVSEVYYALYSLDAITTPVDYNVYYTPPSNAFFIWEAGAQADLAAWQIANAMINVNSAEVDPVFVAVNDLHILSPLANDLGDNTVGITVDIDGDTRPMAPSTTVDIGADEFTPNTDDALTLDILSDISGCGDSITTISVVVQNIGVDTIFSMPVVLNVSNAITQTLNATFNDTLALAEVDTIVMGTINTYAGGNFDMEAYTQLVGDQNVTNDTIMASQFFSPNLPPSASYIPLCVGDSTSLAASGYGNITWYDSLVGGNILATTDTLWTAALFNDTAFYVGYQIRNDSLQTTYAAGSSCTAGNMIDITAIKTFQIDSIAGNFNMPGIQDARLYYIANGTYIGNEMTAAAWTVWDTVSVNANMGYSVIVPSSPIIINAGETYAIYVDYNSVYTNGANTYSNGDMIVDCGVGLCFSFGGNNPRIFNGTIFYSKTACTNERTQVDIVLDTLPTAGYTVSTTIGDASFTDISVNTNSVLYFFGDGNTSNQANPMHTYTTNGVFNAYQVAYSACGTDTFWLDVTISGVGIEDFNPNYHVTIYPNPNNGNFVADIYVDGDENAVLYILSIDGREVYVEDLGTINGRFTKELNLDLPKGIYFVQIQMLEGMILRKLIIQ